ncbi:putative RNA helicase SDE3 [Rosa chinensis]|uniref:Putative RNA helicase SDE3 n=1 Tax=Rosa chinensis TaxID=74649 RepID=A0A2P6R4S0_ROSCH|nr:probable RNA helicase SDE3 [Rosa chinensis]PRQ41437.1 putative RNA helicase SDE3 [Rosa chinensis]
MDHSLAHPSQEDNMDQAPPKVSSLEPPISSSKPPKSSFVDPKLKLHLSAASSQGNNQKGKAVQVWTEMVSSKSSAFSSFSSKPPRSPSPPKFPQSLEPSLSASSSKSKRRNRQRKKKNPSVKKGLSSPSPSTLEPPLVIYSPSPPSSPSSSESPPSSTKLPPALRQTFASAHSHVRDQRGKTCGYSLIKRGLSNPSPSSLKPALLSSSVPPPSCPREHSSSSSGSPPSSPKLPPTLRRAFSSHHSHVANQRGRSYYSWVQKGSLPIYKVPKNIKASIKKDRVPKVLDQPLSPLTYKNYFAALLYAEEVYLEKWKDYQMLEVTLNLQEAIIKAKKKDEKIFVKLKLDSVPERRPFLLSRDFVYARPSGRDVQPFEGILYRVVKSSHILVDFGHDFLYQHHPKRTYDISFSFNRLCFKRAHAAVQAASYPLFQNYIFPDCVPEKIIISNNSTPKAAVRQILGFYGPPPYIIEGQRSVIRTGKSDSKPYKLSKTGEIVREAALQIYKSSPDDRILICAPLNSTCDELMISLKKVIPECDMYRTNAAFREVDEVPIEILLSCDHDGECFSCPPLAELQRFRLIFSTFVTSFRLHNEGVTAGHFSHIFLVDAALATEPETMIALANFANESTAVIVTGSANHQPNQVRSGMARTEGLKTSYFERLSKMRTTSDDT